MWHRGEQGQDEWSGRAECMGERWHPVGGVHREEEVGGGRAAEEETGGGEQGNMQTHGLIFYCTAVQTHTHMLT